APPGFSSVPGLGNQETTGPRPHRKVKSLQGRPRTERRENGAVGNHRGQALALCAFWLNQTLPAKERGLPVPDGPPKEEQGLVSSGRGRGTAPPTHALPVVLPGREKNSTVPAALGRVAVFLPPADITPGPDCR